MNEDLERTLNTEIMMIFSSNKYQYRFGFNLDNCTDMIADITKTVMKVVDEQI